MSESYPTYNNIFYGITEAVILLGLIGNIITFIVYSRPKFAKNSISVYFRALAIFDSFILYQAIVDFYLLLYNFYIVLYSDAVCKLIFYIFYAFGSIPGWILIAFSIDKILNMKKLSNNMKRPIVHYIIILAIVLINLVLYIEVPIYLRLVPIEYYGYMFPFCDPSTLEFSKILDIIYITEGNILPFVIMFVSSLATIKLLRDSRKQMNLIGTVADKRKRRDAKFAVTSLAFNVLFIVLKLPFVICFSIGYVSVSNMYLQTSSLLFFIYHSSSFFIHFVSNILFRNEFFLLFRIPRTAVSIIETRNNKSNTNNMTIN